MSFVDAVPDYRDREMVCYFREDPTTLVKRTYPLQDYFYFFLPSNTEQDTGYFDFHDRPLKKVSFETKREMLDYADGCPKKFESDIPVTYKFLLDNFMGYQDHQPLNILLFDIEVDFDLTEGRGYPGPKNPYGEINAISCFDGTNRRYVMFVPASVADRVSLDDSEYDNFPVEVVYFHNERDLLLLFSVFLEPFDIISAWNGNHFDVPYIIERAMVHFGKSRGASLLCRDGIEASRRDFVNEYGEEVWEWTLRGRHHMDMMLLFKKFHAGEKRSFGLDSICEEVLGIQKMDYDGDLGELFRENPQAFFDYSLHDARLLMMLERKERTLELALTMTRESCILPVDIFGSIKHIEHDFQVYCRQNGGYVLPNRKNNVKDSFDGAVVFDTIKGRHEWIFGIDIVSEYPHIMMILGMSPETVVGQLRGEYEDYVRVMAEDDSAGSLVFGMDSAPGEEYHMLPSEFKALLKEQGWCLSAAGTVFNGKMGILSRWIYDNFQLRNEYKRKLKEARKAGDHGLAGVYDLRQNAIKIGRLNAVYGATGNENFRLFDIRLSKSVTLTAQMVSKAQAIFANEYCNRAEKEAMTNG